MNVGLREIRETDMVQALEEILLPRLLQVLSSRTSGHCMRMADLDPELMVTLTRDLRREMPEAQIWILSDKTGNSDPDLSITSTKLVELRNPLPDGSLRPPLLVFLPANMRASAEDSFGIATFEDISASDVYSELNHSLIARLPTLIQGYICELLEKLKGERWTWADQTSQSRFLLTVVLNGGEEDVVGASLYELGLIPNLKLFEDPAKIMTQIQKNLDCVHNITISDKSIRGRVLALGLKDRALQTRLTAFLLQADIERPYDWTRQIVLDRANWLLSFDKWSFERDTTPEKVFIEVTATDLPTIGENETNAALQGLVGQQVLTPNTHRKMRVSFRVEPEPARVQGLHHFSVQLIARDGGTTGVVKNVPAWKTKKTTVTVTLDKLNTIDFDEGWHFIRVLPWTEHDDPLPLEKAQGQQDIGPKKPNESEPFFVLPEGSVAEDEVSTGAMSADSVEHARLRLQFAAVSDQRDPQDIVLETVDWGDTSGKSRRSAGEHLNVKFHRESMLQISIAAPLKKIEQTILGEPTGPISWRAYIRNGKMGEIEPEITGWPSSIAMQHFLSERTTYCESVRGTKGLISQAADFLSLAPTCLAYAQAYSDLLRDMQSKVERSSGVDQQHALIALRRILALDTVRISVIDHRGRCREAVLLGPTHPLRALWFASWAQVAQKWLTEAATPPLEYIALVRDSLFRRLSLLNMPTTVPLLDGRVFTTIDALNPFWALYGATTEHDSRSLLSDVCSAVSLPEPAIGGTAITGEILANRMARFLAQHPYIRTLTINAFHPGAGQVIADALVALQKQEAFSDLRYDIRLFVPDPEASGVGEAIAQLLTVGTTTSHEAVDAFVKPTGNHLFPKLAFSIRSFATFRQNLQSNRAHLSLLFDLFPAQELAASLPCAKEETIPLHGLMQDFVSHFQDDEQGTLWRQQARHGDALPFNPEEGFTDLLALLPQQISGATASIATGTSAFGQRPTILMGLNAEQRELLHSIHEVSSWVFLIDRYINIEFFDHGGRRPRPEYLIDYAPGTGTDSGHKLIITSRHLAELEAALLPILREYSLPADTARASRVLTCLRALSGRLAMKLMSSPSQQAEALGLALARIYLEVQNILQEQIVLSLDAHLDLFQTAKNQAEEFGEAITLQRTDLALFDFNIETRTITCNLVEVKCYSGMVGIAAYTQLKEKIAAQLNQSKEVLRRHFDPTWKQPDRPDRLLKVREFVTLLGFYLARARRYEIISSDAFAEAEQFLNSLEEGYSLYFTQSALVFDFQLPGTDAPDREAGIEYHRIGVDVIQKLMIPAVDTNSIPTSATSDIPRLEKASFVPPKRNRVRSLESFQRRNSASWKMEDSLPRVETQPESNLEPQDWQQNELPPSLEAEQEIDTGSPQRPRPVSGHKLEDAEIPPPSVPPLTVSSGPEYSVMLGVQGSSPQYGILGEIAGRKVALDLNQTHTISLFGVQGGGKSYTLGTIIEMACLQIKNVNLIPNPLATVVFHYSPTKDYAPEFTSMRAANTEADQLAVLRERYGAEPQALSDILILTPVSKVEAAKAEFPDVEVLPLTFAASELKAMHWKFLMGAVGSQSMYLRQINMIMRSLRDNLTLDALLEALKNATLSDHLRNLAQTRLQFAAEYIDDSHDLTSEIRPGRLIIVDIRDELIEKDEALGLFVVLLQIFSEATYKGQQFNKLVVFDEAHKYIESPDLVSGLIEVVREMRHKGTSILVASQDPPSVPVALIELSSQIILHKMNSPAWLRHIQRANSALNVLTSEKLSNLGAGEAYIWSSKASEDTFTRGAVKVKCRPRVTQHGGSTKTAVSKIGR